MTKLITRKALNALKGIKPIKWGRGQTLTMEDELSLRKIFVQSRLQPGEFIGLILYVYKMTIPKAVLERVCR